MGLKKLLIHMKRFEPKIYTIKIHKDLMGYFKEQISEVGSWILLKNIFHYIKIEDDKSFVAHKKTSICLSNRECFDTISHVESTLKILEVSVMTNGNKKKDEKRTRKKLSTKAVAIFDKLNE